MSASAGSTQQFELTVPNDRVDADLVGITLRLPPSVELVAATARQPRWSVASAGGAITWSGGPIAALAGETFAFTATMPADPGELELLLVETYDDGAGPPSPIGVTVTGQASVGGGGDSLAVAALLVALAALGLATPALLVALRRPRRT